MTQEDALRTFENRVRARYTSDNVNLITPVAFENVEGLITKCDGSGRIDKPPTDGYWLRVTLNEVGLGQVDMAANARGRALGHVNFELYSPRGKGTREARRLAELAANTCARFAAAGLQASVVRPLQAGVDPIERMWVNHFIVPYTRDFFTQVAA